MEERYLGGEGATATSEARVQVIRPLTINKQFHTMVEFTGYELTFDRARDQPYLDMMLNPRAKTLANKVENFIASSFQTQVYQYVGTPGVAITFDTVLLADAYMTALGIPEDGNRYFANDPFVSAALSNALYNVFNMTVNRGALLDGFIGHLAGFDFFKTNFLQRQIAGTPDAATAGTPPTGFLAAGQITAGPISGGNVLTITGLDNSSTAGAILFNVGDLITIDAASGVYMVNPLTYEPIYSATAQFVVTQQVVSLGTGSGTTYSVQVSPTIVVSGARQNISAAIPNGAQLYRANSHNVSIAYHNQAVVFAAPPIKELKGGVEAVTTYSDLYKLAMTYTLGADIRNYIQLDRLDVICGDAINPEFAVVVMS